jgi:hypothetical protein
MQSGTAPRLPFAQASARSAKAVPMRDPFIAAITLEAP